LYWIFFAWFVGVVIGLDSIFACLVCAIVNTDLIGSYICLFLLWLVIITWVQTDTLDDLLAKRVTMDQVLRKEEEALAAQKADHAQLKETVASLQRTKAATTDEIRELNEAVAASGSILAHVRTKSNANRTFVFVNFIQCHTCRIKNQSNIISYKYPTTAILAE
jgi:hypothetical protein